MQFLTLAMMTFFSVSEPKSPQKISVPELASLLEKKVALSVFDANGAETRNTMGVIPGAKLLSNYTTYDVEKELPGDKALPLVFYCGGPKCTAAPQAAQRAVRAGYSHVSVLEAGIKGWVDAKQPVQKPAT